MPDSPLLDRDNPDKSPLVGNIKVTREDWLRIALRALVQNGIEGVKIQALGAQLNVSRSSFYWYFDSRQDLLDALLTHWEATNTAALVDMASRSEATITAAVGNVFRCFINPALFDTRLDFAIRDWARRSPKVRQVLQQSEGRRLDILQKMFEQHAYSRLEAIARARILYYMQIGYDDAQLNEPIEARNLLTPAYLIGFTGQQPTSEEIANLRTYAASVRPDSPQ